MHFPKDRLAFPQPLDAAAVEGQYVMVGRVAPRRVDLQRAAAVSRQGAQLLVIGAQAQVSSGGHRYAVPWVASGCSISVSPSRTLSELSVSSGSSSWPVLILAIW